MNSQRMWTLLGRAGVVECVGQKGRGLCCVYDADGKSERAERN